MLGQLEAAQIAAEQDAKYEIVEHTVPRTGAASFQVFEAFEDKKGKFFRGEFTSLQAAENWVKGK